MQDGNRSIFKGNSAISWGESCMSSSQMCPQVLHFLVENYGLSGSQRPLTRGRYPNLVIRGPIVEHLDYHARSWMVYGVFRCSPTFCEPLVSHYNFGGRVMRMISAKHIKGKSPTCWNHMGMHPFWERFSIPHDIHIGKFENGLWHWVCHTLSHIYPLLIHLLSLHTPWWGLMRHD